MMQITIKREILSDGSEVFNLVLYGEYHAVTQEDAYYAAESIHAVLSERVVDDIPNIREVG